MAFSATPEQARGFTVVALLDADPSVVGETIGGMPVHHVDDLEAVLASHEVQIGVVATPAAHAQEVCDRLVSAGVAGVLNFAPCVLNVPDGVMVRRVDLSTELQILAFHQQRRAAAELAADALGSDLLASDLQASGEEVAG